MVHVQQKSEHAWRQSEGKPGDRRGSGLRGSFCSGCASEERWTAGRGRTSYSHATGAPFYFICSLGTTSEDDDEVSSGRRQFSRSTVAIDFFGDGETWRGFFAGWLSFSLKKSNMIFYLYSWVKIAVDPKSAVFQFLRWPPIFSIGNYCHWTVAVPLTPPGYPPLSRPRIKKRNDIQSFCRVPTSSGCWWS